MKGVEGMTVVSLGSIGFSVNGPCTGGSPRFNLFYDSDGNGTVDGVGFCGCGNHVTGVSGAWTTMSVAAGSPDFSYDFAGGSTFSSGAAVTLLAVLVDETGTYYVDDLKAAGSTTGEPNGA